MLIHRVTLSTIGVLCQLGATVRLRDELEAWLPGFLSEAMETVDSEADADADADGTEYAEEEGEPEGEPVQA